MLLERGAIMHAASRLTVKYQATIPAVVRKRLGLEKGDYVLFELDAHQHVVVRKAEPTDVRYLKALEGTLKEWDSAQDEEAYRDL
jgi:AbrB family looped-hinge helix DNA binding protein